jgi:hypothetical protein
MAHRRAARRDDPGGRVPARRGGRRRRGGRAADQRYVRHGEQTVVDERRDDTRRLDRRAVRRRARRRQPVGCDRRAERPGVPAGDRVHAQLHRAGGPRRHDPAGGAVDRRVRGRRLPDQEHAGRDRVHDDDLHVRHARPGAPGQQHPALPARGRGRVRGLPRRRQPHRSGVRVRAGDRTGRQGQPGGLPAARPEGGDRGHRGDEAAAVEPGVGDRKAARSRHHEASRYRSLVRRAGADHRLLLVHRVRAGRAARGGRRVEPPVRHRRRRLPEPARGRDGLLLHEPLGHRHRRCGRRGRVRAGGGPRGSVPQPGRRLRAVPGTTGLDGRLDLRLHPRRHGRVVRRG